MRFRLGPWSGVRRRQAQVGSRCRQSESQHQVVCKKRAGLETTKLPRNLVSECVMGFTNRVE